MFETGASPCCFGGLRDFARLSVDFAVVVHNNLVLRVLVKTATSQSHLLVLPAVSVAHFLRSAIALSVAHRRAPTTVATARLLGLPTPSRRRSPIPDRAFTHTPAC